ncbi:MAG: helix-hairpin-helix domain-containing protein [Acidobacteriota bacterium]
MNRLKRLAAAFLALACVAVGTASAQARSGAKVDLNSASSSELEALPGVGAATAKKIIAGRPYSSAVDLSKAGVSAATIQKISGMVTVSGARSTSAASAPAAARESRTRPEPAHAGGMGSSSSQGSVELNSASQKDLEALPGVGAATAKKIIAGRPYTSVADLSKAGVSEATIRKISPLVTVSSSRPADASSGRSGSGSAAASAPAPSSARSAGGASANAGGPVDLNSASQKDLEALPEVGPATARKIMAGRPYSSVGDLGRAGVSAATISKISPLVTVRGSSSASPSSSSSSSSASSAPAAGSAAATRSSGGNRTAPAASAPYQAPPSPGMVWVNLETKVFHREGDKWYGRTKRGRYMSEADAVKGGYRLSKEKDEPK